MKLTNERLCQDEIDSIMGELNTPYGELDNRDLRNVKIALEELLTLRSQNKALIEDAERLNSRLSDAYLSQVEEDTITQSTLDIHFDLMQEIEKGMV